MLLYIERSGSPEAPPIVFLHGFLGCGRDWAEISDALAADYHCLAVDLPGHGRSGPAPADWTMAAQAILESVAALELAPPVLVGYSMGGRLALYLALRHAERFRGLALESSSPGLRSPAERAERRASDARLAQALEQEDMADFLTRWYSQPLFATLQRHPRFTHIQTQRGVNDGRRLAQALRGLGTGAQPSLWEEWPACQLPTLLLSGALDEKYGGISAEMSRLNPRACRLVLPDCGHNTHLEAPEAFSAALRAFLPSCFLV